jgi:hypothetical protein
MELYGEFASRIVALDHALVLDILRDLPIDAPAPAILVYKRGRGLFGSDRVAANRADTQRGHVSSLPRE